MDTSELPAFDSLILHRIESIFRILKDIKEEVSQARIPGRSEESFKNTVAEIIDKVLSDLRNTVAEISEVRDPGIKIQRSSIIHRIFEDFSYEIDTILRHSSRVPIEVHYFVEIVLSDLELRSGMQYLLIFGRDLSTTNFASGLRRLFAIFPGTQEYIRSNLPFFWEIVLPPSLVRSCIDWPLITHEIAHIMEDQFWKIVERHYPFVSMSYSECSIKCLYAKEFQADYIATAYIGPIFATRTLLNYFTKEIRISPTHPSWSERLDAMEEQLKVMGFSLPEYESMSHVLPKERSLIGRDHIEHLPEIIRETMRHLQGRTLSSAWPTEDEKRKAMNRMTQLAPYIGDPRLLLNIADEAKRQMIHVSCKTREEKEELEREFNYILVDSVRLAWLNRVFKPVLD